MTLIERGVGKGRGRGDVGLPWTDVRVARLRDLHTQGYSCSQIAADLGGVTRNAVIGKVHRLDLSNRKLKAAPTSVAGPKQPRMHNVANHKRIEDLSRPSPAKTLVGKRVKIRPGANTSTSKEVEHLDATEIIDLPPDTSEFACTIAGLDSVVDRTQCRWPLGEPSAEMLYCGAPSWGSFCPRHRRIAYSPLRTRAG